MWGEDWFTFCLNTPLEVLAAGFCYRASFYAKLSYLAVGYGFMFHRYESGIDPVIHHFASNQMSIIPKKLNGCFKYIISSALL